MTIKIIFTLFLVAQTLEAASEMGRVTDVVSPTSVRMHFASGDRIVHLAGLTSPDDPASQRLMRLRLQFLTSERWLLVEEDGGEARIFRTPDGTEINALLIAATPESLAWQAAHPDVTYLGELSLPPQRYARQPARTTPPRRYSPPLRNARRRSSIRN